MAKLSKKAIRGKKRWVADWYDYSQGKDAKVRKQVLCETFQASNDILRKKLLDKYNGIETNTLRDVEIHGVTQKLKINTISDAVKDYLNTREKQVQLRKRQGGKQGLAQSYFLEIKRSMQTFSTFCKDNKITLCKEFTLSKTKEFKEWIELYEGEKSKFSVHSKNKILRNIKTFLNSFRHEHPPVFDETDLLISILKKFQIEEQLQFYFKPNQLLKILTKAAEHDCRKCSITRNSKKKGKKHSGEMPLRTIPLLPHILLMLMNGMRRADGLQLTWDNIDL